MRKYCLQDQCEQYKFVSKQNRESEGRQGQQLADFMLAIFSVRHETKHLLFIPLNSATEE